MLSSLVIIPLFFLVFLVFGTMLSGLISLLGGWYRFEKKYPLLDLINQISVFDYSSIQFNTIGSYNNCIRITLYKEGVGLEPLLVFRAFHKPVFIAWNQIDVMYEKKEFFYPTLDVYVDGNKIRFYGKAMKAIMESYQKK